MSLSGPKKNISMADSKTLIHIFPEVVEGPFGGGNQFAKALRANLMSRGKYAGRVEDANVLLFNGYPFRSPLIFYQAMRWKQKKPDERAILMRIDGPIATTRHDATSEKFDRALYTFSTLAADGVICQSQWSHEQISKHALAPQKCAFTIIGNAPNPELFYPPKLREPISGRRVRIVATSWSSNPHKGFQTYSWLDQHLDFERFDFSVIAPTVTRYENIKVLDPVGQTELGHLLRASDIYLTASRLESCSNAVLEALHCGLPVIAPNASSHPEYVPSLDLLFNKKEEIPSLLEQVKNNMVRYQKEIYAQSIDQIAQCYLEFIITCRQSKLKIIDKNESKEFLNSNEIKYGRFSDYFLRNKVFIKHAVLKRRSK
jgi:glycosyltransferase involved in cell wall biosynthesis